MPNEKRDTIIMCSGKVYRGTDGWRGRYDPCSKRAKVERDGVWYCGVHDPVARKEKDDKRHTEWKQRQQTELKATRFKYAAQELCEGVDDVVLKDLGRGWLKNHLAVLGHKPSIVLAQVVAGDWEGLYIDGKLVTEDHDLDTGRVLTALGLEYKWIEVDDEHIEEAGGRFPAAMSDHIKQIVEMS